ncbi:TlpA family protein disulfide reductase [bacterium]|nr:TlpA family protein disulfide reductase [bacterium]
MLRVHSCGVGIIVIGLLAGCQVPPESVENKSGRQAVQSLPDKDSTVPVSQGLLDFKVKSLEGETVHLKQYLGKIVILDLFATWCPPCKQEIPFFVEFQQTYQDSLVVVGLSYDQIKADKVKAFVKKMKINYPVYWGSQEIAKQVGLRGIPHTLVLDQEGRIASTYVGYRPKEVFEADIKKLLK